MFFAIFTFFAAKDILSDLHISAATVAWMQRSVIRVRDMFAKLHNFPDSTSFHPGYNI
jgi:hypothetical protein